MLVVVLGDMDFVIVVSALAMGLVFVTIVNAVWVREAAFVLV